MQRHVHFGRSLAVHLQQFQAVRRARQRRGDSGGRGGVQTPREGLRTGTLQSKRVARQPECYNKRRLSSANRPNVARGKGAMPPNVWVKSTD